MKTVVIVYQVIQIVTYIIFVGFISDFRKKNKMIPLINPKLTLLLKLCYLIPIIIYIFTLVMLKELHPIEFLVPPFTILGTFLVMRAKRDLGRFHTWTGYFAEASEFVCNGVYAFIRHPLYTGIYLIILSAAVTVILHAQWYLTLIFLVSIFYVMFFIATSARRETRSLVGQFGEPFRCYSEKVHPFLPLRRFTVFDLTEKKDQTEE